MAFKIVYPVRSAVPASSLTHSLCLQRLLEELDMMDDTECKFNVNSFKMVYVVNSESYLYKRTALKRARQVRHDTARHDTARHVSCRCLHIRFRQL